MALKEFLCRIANEQLGCNEQYKTAIGRLISEKTVLNQKLFGVIGEKGLLENKVANLAFQQVKTEEALSLCMQAYMNPTDVPTKSIKYRRNVFLGDKLKWVQKSISVRNYITVNDDLIGDKIRSKKLFLHELSDIDTLAPKIYQAAMYGRKYMGVERSTFIIDKTGKVRKIFRKVKVADHNKEVMEALKELK